jgi:hypothetical protein
MAAPSPRGGGARGSAMRRQGPSRRVPGTGVDRRGLTVLLTLRVGVSLASADVDAGPGGR